MNVKLVLAGLALLVFFGPRSGKGPITAERETPTPPGEVPGDRLPIAPTERG